MLVDRPYAMSHNPAYAISHIKHMADVTYKDTGLIGNVYMA